MESQVNCKFCNVVPIKNIKIVVSDDYSQVCELTFCIKVCYLFTP